MTQKTLYMQCFFIVGQQASRTRQHGRRPTGAHAKHAQGASGPVGGDAGEIGRFGLLVSCYGEGVPTGRACPPGGRAHREGVPTGRACPPGGRAHREGVPTGRARVAALESQPALWVIKSFRWHQPAIQTTHCTPRLARGTAGHEIGVIFTYPSSNQMCTR